MAESYIHASEYVEVNKTNPVASTQLSSSLWASFDSESCSTCYANKCGHISMQALKAYINRSTTVQLLHC